MHSNDDDAKKKVASKFRCSEPVFVMINNHAKLASHSTQLKHIRFLIDIACKEEVCFVNFNALLHIFVLEISF